MAKQMTITELKKELNQLDHKQLVEVICNLYKIDEKVKEILCTRFMGEEYKLEALKEYKDKIYNIFFPKNLRTLPSLKNAKSLITDFKKIGDYEMVIDLMLYYVECGNEFTNDYGDINGPFYDSLCSVFGQFVDQLNFKGTKALYLKFEERISNLITNSSHIGWGYGDFISDKAFEIEWIGEE